MPILSRAPQDIREFVSEVMSQYHQPLLDAGVTIGVLIADPTERDMNNGEPPFLKLNGYPRPMLINITPSKQRIQGIADAVITIDGESWKGFDDEERTSNVDHELEKISLVKDKISLAVKTDDHDRPKLKIRLYDVVVTGFSRIIKRHGLKAIEAQQLHELFTGYRQNLFSWSDDFAPADSSAPSGSAIIDRIRETAEVGNG